MSFLTAIKGTGSIDLKQLRRQSFLLYLILLPVLNGLLLRGLVPLARERFIDGVELEIYYPLIVSSLLVVLTPVLMGTVVGFLLLDERDEQTLTALLVTPLPMQVYLLYRIAIPTLLSIIMTLAGVWSADLASPGWVPLLVICIGNAIVAPIVSLVYFCFSENKVQGFGVLKILGAISFSLPIAAYFIPIPQQYLFGIFPLYWFAKAYWLACDGSAWTWSTIMIGFGLSGGLLKRLMDRFLQVAYR